MKVLPVIRNLARKIAGPTAPEKILRQINMLGRNQFKASESNRLNASWTATNEDINYTLEREGKTMRARSRWIIRNTEYGAAARTAMMNYCVGIGFKLQMQVGTSVVDPEHGDTIFNEDDAFNSLAEGFHKIWAKNAGAQGAETCPVAWVDCQEMGMDRWIEDGEIIVETRVDKSRAGVPMSINFIDPEDLDVYRMQGKDKFPVRMGVEYDPETYQTRAIWVYVESKNDLFSVKTMSRRIDVSDLVHHYIRRQPKQLRGIPWVSAVTQKFFQQADYTDAQMDRNRVASYFSVFFKNVSGGGSGIFDEESDKDEDGFAKDADGNKISTLAPGMMGNLPEGVEPHMLNPTSPDNNFTPFMKHTTTGIGAGLEYGLSYTSLTRDTTDTTFAGGTKAEQMDMQGFRRVQAKFERGFLIPLTNKFMDIAVTSGAIDAPGYFFMPGMREHYTNHYHMAAAWAKGINPLQDARAREKDMENGTTNLIEECAAQGKDWRQVLQGAAKVMREKKRLGLWEEPEADPKKQAENDKIDADNDAQIEEEAKAKPKKETAKA